MKAPSRLALIAAFGAVYVIWGSTYLAIRFAVETLPPFLMAATRFLVAGGLLLAWVGRRRGGERLTARHWGAATVVGGLMLLAGNGTVVWAEQFVASGLVALLVATVPLWMVLLDWARPGGTRPGPAVVLGLAVGFAGVAVLIGPGNGAADAVALLPALALLGASAAWALGSIYSRRASLPSTPLLSTAVQMLAGGALLAVVGLASGEAAAIDPEVISQRSVLGLVYLIVFGSLIAFSAYVWLLRVSTPAKVSTYAYVNPMVAVLLGAALANEPLTPRVGVAALLVIAAVALVTLKRRAPAAESATRDAEAADAVRPPSEGAPTTQGSGATVLAPSAAVGSAVGCAASSGPAVSCPGARTGP